jgi:outer membrane receptor protein involved in Fe transport
MPDLQAINDRATIAQDSYGAGVQLTLDNQLSGLKNQTVLGASVDANRVRYVQQQQDAIFSATRESVGIDDFVQTVDAKTSGQSAGVYINNITELTPQLTLTLSGRYNRSTVQIRDQTGTAPDLNADSVFTRFNPAIGLNFNPNTNTTYYGTINQGMRAPTAIELTCADPTSPCRLPNSFLADPPLKPVISRTMEIGARGKFGEVVKGKQQSSWSAALFRTELTDDIQFISSGSGLNAGYFANVGNTQRQGLELALSHSLGSVKVTARYSLVQARFRSSYVSHSPSNDTADANGDIVVSPGNIMPSIAPQSFKLRFDYSPTDALSIGMSANYSSAVYPRGSENNLDSRGKVPGFTLVNLDARYNLTKQLQLFARVNNLFDKRYSNFGVLGANYFTAPGRSFGPLAGIVDQPTEQFRGLGAPRGIWVGLSYAFDEAAVARRND